MSLEKQQRLVCKYTRHLLKSTPTVPSVFSVLSDRDDSILKYRLAYFLLPPNAIRTNTFYWCLWIETDISK